MRDKTNWMLFLICAAVLCPASGWAYVGPGAGLTLAGVLWGVIAAFGALLAGIFVWPIRALIRRRRQKNAESDAPVSGDAPDDAT